MKDRVHVVAAAVFNGAGEVLIARRPGHVHQGGLWEFPGGKLEHGETPEAALRRELEEEVGLTPSKARPLIQIDYDYPDKSVFLDVWRVDAYQGEAHGREGQPLRWVLPDLLRPNEFPAANVPIIAAVRLPQTYLITPEPGDDKRAFLQRLEARLRDGIRLVQLRAKSLDTIAYRALAAEAMALAKDHQAEILLNASPRLALELDADGVHLPSARLMALSSRPLPAHKWLAASCHNADELRHAERIGADFVVVSPVLPTASHGDARPLGFDGLRRLCRRASVPVYALGGLDTSHLDESFRCGAQGIAAIRGLW